MYFAGSVAYTSTAVRALAEAEVGKAWYNIMSLIGVLTYMIGSIAFTGLAVSMHRTQLRVEMRHARELINGLIKTHAMAFELAPDGCGVAQVAAEIVALRPSLTADRIGGDQHGKWGIGEAHGDCDHTSVV